MAIDFKRFPELSNAQMETYYFMSPHKQILEDIRVRVIKVTDGDTIKVRWSQRDFDFPVRFLDINASELSEERGDEVRSWLEQRIQGAEVDIQIDPLNRVDKWGRLLGRIFFLGQDMGQDMLRQGLVTTFDARNEGKIPQVNKELAIEKWL